ncbi:MAG: transposase [Gammaproteobacteria bacterium]|nr:transposase [Gammaproteobacteria bacterium]
MSRKKSVPYAEEFKRSSAQLAFESEQSIKNTAKDLGLNPSTLYTWVEKYYPEALILPGKIGHIAKQLF